MLSDKHPKQQERLDTLRAYQILDSASEADFDDIVALASSICDAPVSLISLVDDQRQWFVARVGFKPQQTSLRESVCSHAMLQDGFLEIEDMSADDRTADNPLHLHDPNVKFYAGAQLIAPNGLPMGTLCVLDTKPRRLSPFQKQALQTLSRQVMVQMELRKRLLQETAIRSETDHRVKNSLQTLGSILHLSARSISDPDAIEVLQLVERRLGAVASLHSELMGREGEGTVDAQQYLARVGQLLKDASPGNVEVTFDASDAALDAKKASAIGMIVSEFVANSTKHAFPDGQNGVVDLSLSKSGPRDWTLTCSDNGIGSGEAEAAKSGDTGLGEMLMSAATDQLEGEIKQTSTMQGTSLTVQFRS